MKNRFVLEQGNNRLMPKILIIILAVLIFLLGVWGALSFAARQLVDKRLASIENAYNLQITYRSVSLKGLSGLSLKGVSFKAAHSPIRFSAGSFDIRTNFIKPSDQGYEIKSFYVSDLNIYFASQASTASTSKAGINGNPN